MKPTYYFKAIHVGHEKKYKMVANFGLFKSYLLGKTMTWADLQDFEDFEMRIVVDSSSYVSSFAKDAQDELGLEEYLFLAPGFRMTRNTQDVKVAADSCWRTLRKKTKVIKGTDKGNSGCGCGPSFHLTEYEYGVDSVKADSIHNTPKRSFWKVIFG